MACCPNEIHVGDTNVAIILEVLDCATDAAQDISSATTKQIKLEGPDKSVDTYTASFTTDGTDGKIQIVTDANTIDDVGCWHAQGWVETPNGNFSTKLYRFKALRKLT